MTASSRRDVKSGVELAWDPVVETGVPNLDGGGVDFGVVGGVEVGVDFGVVVGVEVGVDFGVDFGVVGGVEVGVDGGVGFAGGSSASKFFFSNFTELIVQLMGFPYSS